MQKIRDYSLYLVISEEYGKGRGSAEIAERAISGGVDIIQMREKDKPEKALFDLGKKLSGLCKKNGVTFIVNDNPELAASIDACGVHLGQDDLKHFTLNKARRIVGNKKIIGVSTHSEAQFEEANKDDVDYIAFGPIFPTKTKDYCIGTKAIEKILKTALKPVVFIGGIDLSNVEEVLSRGAKNIALIRAIAGAADITASARIFRQLLDKNRIEAVR